MRSQKFPWFIPWEIFKKDSGDPQFEPREPKNKLAEPKYICPGPKHLSLKIQYVEFNINVPLHQQYLENLMSQIYDIELLNCTLL